MSVWLLWKTKPLKKFSIFNQHVCASVPLFCYTCVFPAISPLDCIRFPLKCPPGQVCLSSRAVGEKGEGHRKSTEQNLNDSKLRKRTEKDGFKHRGEMSQCGSSLRVSKTDVSNDSQETSLWFCMRRAASCPPCVESQVKNTPWDSTSPSPMNAATHTCAMELQHLLPHTGLAY